MHAWIGLLISRHTQNDHEREKKDAQIVNRRISKLRHYCCCRCLSSNKLCVNISGLAVTLAAGFVGLGARNRRTYSRTAMSASATRSAPMHTASTATSSVLLLAESLDDDGDTTMSDTAAGGGGVAQAGHTTEGGHQTSPGDGEAVWRGGRTGWADDGAGNTNCSASRYSVPTDAPACHITCEMVEGPAVSVDTGIVTSCQLVVAVTLWMVA